MESQIGSSRDVLNGIENISRERNPAEQREETCQIIGQIFEFEKKNCHIVLLKMA